MKLNSALIKVRTAFRLGLRNIASVMLYRARLKLMGVIDAPVPLPSLVGDFFCSPAVRSVFPKPSAFSLRYFEWMDVQVAPGSRPDWFYSPSTDRRADKLAPWYRLEDFDPRLGDIKWIWEFSRWSWVVRLAQHVAYSPAPEALFQLNDWLSDWCEENKPYCGPNWKCGQEASIRILHLACAAQLLGSVDSSTTSLRALVRLHLDRILPTVGYAKAQDNNHGTSEAAGLFVGGTWLERSGVDRGGFSKLGRDLLEERVARLISDDGTFSQYSVNYHRMVLDTLTFVESWRRHLNEPEFSELFYIRAAALAKWLRAMVDEVTGEAPNIGANDGSRLFQLTEGYRDFRPSVQAAFALFLDQRAYSHGPWDDALSWMRISTAHEMAPRLSSQSFRDGGFAVLRCGGARLITRFPRFRFRPAHADALHVDFWLGHRNILIDSGTYSYNTSDSRMLYFGSCSAHNTVQFDDRDQMPRVSRFLYGEWLKGSGEGVERHEDGSESWRGEYTDWYGATHCRSVVVANGRCAILDKISGFAQKAVLRWHLAPGAWCISDGVVTGMGVKIEVRTEGEPVRIELKGAEISTYYGQALIAHVLEVEVGAPQSIVTEIMWQ